MSNSFQSCGLKHARLLCPWDSPGKNIGVGCHSLLQGIFLTQGLNPGLPHCRPVLHRWGRGEAPNSISRDCQISSGVKEWTHPWKRTIMWIKRGFYLAQHPPWLLLDPLHTSQRPHVFPSGPFSGVIMTDMVDLAMNSLPLKLHVVSATWFSGSSKVFFYRKESSGPRVLWAFDGGWFHGTPPFSLWFHFVQNHQIYNYLYF